MQRRVGMSGVTRSSVHICAVSLACSISVSLVVSHPEGQSSNTSIRGLV